MNEAELKTENEFLKRRVAFLEYEASKSDQHNYRIISDALGRKSRQIEGIYKYLEKMNKYQAFTSHSMAYLVKLIDEFYEELSHLPDQARIEYINRHMSYRRTLIYGRNQDFKKECMEFGELLRELGINPTPKANIRVHNSTPERLEAEICQLPG